MLENLITAGYMHPWEDDGYDEIRKLSATALSMNFPGNFFHIGDIATAGLKELVHDLTEEQWRSFALRQKRYEVHTIPFSASRSRNRHRFASVAPPCRLGVLSRPNG